MPNNLLGLNMNRSDFIFTPDAEQFIVKRADRLRNPYSLSEEFVVLFNILRVERKDAYGRVVKTKGPFVYVGMERSIKGLEFAVLPSSGARVYLSGFTEEIDPIVAVNFDRSSKEGFLFIDREKSIDLKSF